MGMSSICDDISYHSRYGYAGTSDLEVQEDIMGWGRLAESDPEYEAPEHFYK